MPRPPPRFSSGSSTPSSSRTCASSPTTRCAATSKPAGVEDLRADVRVQPDQLEPRRGQHPADRLEGVAAGQREPELLVLVRGRDELVGVRLDADGRAHQHPLASRRARRTARPAGRSRRTSRPRPGRPRRRGRRPARRPTCCCRAAAIRSPGKPARTRDRELAAGADVEAEALLLDPARDRRAQERLGRVEHHRAAERLAVVAAAARAGRPRRAGTPGVPCSATRSRTSRPRSTSAPDASRPQPSGQTAGSSAPRSAGGPRAGPRGPARRTGARRGGRAPSSATSARAR